jgi:16S rRNA (uracil1498-N3)-methyltransferase
MLQTKSHQFAFYCKNFSRNRSQHELIISDEKLIHRIVRVLRFSIGDSCIFFDDLFHAQAKLEAVEKKTIRVSLGMQQPNVSITPTINAYIPILKKDALGEAVYLAVEMGTQAIYLTETEKTHGGWNNQREIERISDIIIAACEQAKQFCIPSLYAPEKLTTLFDENTFPFFVCDPQGASLLKNLAQLRTVDREEISLVIGPEAGLTQTEIAYLKSKGGQLSSLTPTILRAPHAISLAVGITRCFFQVAADKP